MRVVELDKFLELRKKLDRRVSLYYGIITGVVFFIFGIFSGILAGLGWGIFMFVFGTLSIYGIRFLTNNTVDKARQRLELEGTVLDVIFNGEFGLLVIKDKLIKYISLTRFSQNKIKDIEVNEDLFIAVGELQYVRLQKYKYGEFVKCHITLNQMPNGPLYQFTFFEVDGVLEKITAELDKINCFNLEKYQG